MWRLFIQISPTLLDMVPFHMCPTYLEHEGQRYQLLKADLKKCYGLYELVQSK